MADYAGSILQTTPVWKNEKNEVAQKPRNYKDNTTLDMTDFYTLMAAQLKYQDVLNPESNTPEMMTSMVQMAMVNALSDLQTMTQTTYAASMMGKTVTVAETTADGKLKVVEGVVEGVSLYDGDPKIIVNGKEYPMSAIMQLGTKTETAAPDKGDEDTDKVTGGGDDGDDTDKVTGGGDDGDDTSTGGVTDGGDSGDNGTGGVTDGGDSGDNGTGGVTDGGDSGDNGGSEAADGGDGQA